MVRGCGCVCPPLRLPLTPARRVNVSSGEERAVSPALQGKLQLSPRPTSGRGESCSLAVSHALQERQQGRGPPPAPSGFPCLGKLPLAALGRKFQHADPQAFPRSPPPPTGAGAKGLQLPHAAKSGSYREVPGRACGLQPRGTELHPSVTICNPTSSKRHATVRRGIYFCAHQSRPKTLTLSEPTQVMSTRQGRNLCENVKRFSSRDLQETIGN